MKGPPVVDIKYKIDKIVKRWPTWAKIEIHIVQNVRRVAVAFLPFFLKKSRKIRM